MDTETLESVRAIFHYGSIVLLCLGVGLAVIGFFRPKAFIRFFHEFSQRRFILLTAVFVCLLSGTIFTVTYPASETLQSNAPRPSTQSTNDLKNLEDETLPLASAQVAQPLPTPSDPQPAPSDQIEPQKPKHEPVKWGDNQFTGEKPAQQTKPNKTESSQPQKDKNCRLELLFVCL